MHLPHLLETAGTGNLDEYGRRPQRVYMPIRKCTTLDAAHLPDALPWGFPVPTCVSQLRCDMRREWSSRKDENFKFLKLSKSSRSAADVFDQSWRQDTYLNLRVL